MRITILVLLAFLALPAKASGEVRPMVFGLRFGASIGDVKKQGVELTRFGESAGLTLYEASGAPNVPEGFDCRLQLGFHPKKGLLWAQVITERIIDTPYGGVLKNRYDAIKSALRLKYSLVATEERWGNSKFNEPEYFLRCLQYEECGVWRTTFKGDDRMVIASLTAFDFTSGYISISVSAHPELEDLGREFEKKAARKLLDTL
jgi:hypothetical protein